MITVVDNYDSFTYNLVQQIERLAGERLRVIRNDAFEPGELLAEEPKAIIISPGPGTPARAGRCIELIRANRTTPLLGVCLGHQAIGAAFGVEVTEAPELMHGMVSEVVHDGSALFDGIPSPFSAGRYHSLALAESALPAELIVTARAEHGTVMAIAHRELPVLGVQFHPESVLTEGGYRLLANWLALVGDPDAVARAAALSPLRGYSPVQ